MNSPTKILQNLGTIDFWVLSAIAMTLWLLLIYSNSFTGGFVMDDPRIINDKIVEQAIPEFGESRSLVDATFAFNYKMGQLDPFGYHIFNFLIHLINGLLVIGLVLSLSTLPVLKKSFFKKSKRLLAVSIGFLFASHPLQTMAVTYIVQRYLSIATMWYLLAVILFIHTRRYLIGKNKNWLIFIVGICGILILYLLGMHSKLVVATLPAILFLIEWLGFRKGKFPWIISSVVAVTGLVSLWFVSSFYHFGILTSTKENTMGELVTTSSYTLTQFKGFLLYIFKLTLPLYQNADYYMPLSQSVFDFQVILGIIAWIGVWTAFFLARKKLPLVAIGIGWFLITPLVTSSIFTITDVVNEYRMYLPSIGFLLAVISFVFYKLRKNEWTFVSIITIIIIIFGALTFNRNFVYADGFTYWGDVIKKSPEKARGHVNYAVELHQRGDAVGASTHYRKALEIDPDRLTALANLGVLYTQLGDFENAVVYFDRTLAIDPEYLDALNGKGVVLLNQGNPDEAEALFLKVLEIDPENNAARENLKLVERQRQNESN